MTFNSLRYKLAQGFIHHWLVTGPLVSEITDQPQAFDSEWEAGVYDRYYDAEPGTEDPIVDRKPLGTITEFKPHLIWKYYRCREDHYINLSSTYAMKVHLKSWAYSKVSIEADGEFQLQIAAAGPFDVWVNGKHEFRNQNSKHKGIQNIQLSVPLKAGENDLLVRFEQIPVDRSFYGIAVKMVGVPGDAVEIVLPTEIEPELIQKRQDLEKAVEKATTQKYVYGYPDGDRYNQNEPITLFFAEEMERGGDLVCRVQSLKGNIFQERAVPQSSSSTVPMAKAFPLWNGPHHLAILPHAEDYYKKNLAFERKDLFYVVRQAYTDKSTGTFKQRAKDALTAASEQKTESIFTEIARMALKKWDKVNDPIVNKALERINRAEPKSILDLLGLMGALERFGSRKNILGKLRTRIQDAALGYRYSELDPGWDAMNFKSESSQLLFLTGEILAGQMLPDQTFVRSGMSGTQHRLRAEEQVLTWLKQRGMYGFREWDSPASIESNLVALSHLVEFAQAEAVQELASVLLDKIFFSLAINSFKGAFGSARGESDTASVLSHRLSATSGISKLMWGQGNFNSHVAGIVSLACCRNYDLPGIINTIAKDRPAGFWSLEQHSSPEQDSWSVNKATYRSAEFMLSSAQDYYPGQPGKAEQIWQATLGPDAVIFTNHPVNISDDDANYPNTWVGNGVCPRAAQWGDVLAVLYKLPENDWMGFTHAYFPTHVFDEYAIQSGWAFARVGKGYAALTASTGFDLIDKGHTAYRERRAYGQETVWLCHMGQELLDGSFEDFQEKILKMEVSFDGLGVGLKSLRGDQIEFGWADPLKVNQDEQPLTNFRHFENIYCVTELPAKQMDIIYQKQGIRLSFGD